MHLSELNQTESISSGRRGAKSNAGDYFRESSAEQAEWGGTEQPKEGQNPEKSANLKSTDTGSLKMTFAQVTKPR